MTDRVCYRADGRVEFLCEHGIGHTFSVPEKYIDEDAWWSHGCDGCCDTDLQGNCGGYVP